MKAFGTLLASLFFAVSFTTDAYAYLDPGTGSILLQGLLALIAGTAVTLKIYWAKVRGFFSREKTEPEPHKD
jgi:hypothetical protein